MQPDGKHMFSYLFEHMFFKPKYYNNVCLRNTRSNFFTGSEALWERNGATCGARSHTVSRRSGCGALPQLNLACGGRPAPSKIVSKACI